MVIKQILGDLQKQFWKSLLRNIHHSNSDVWYSSLSTAITRNKVMFHCHLICHFNIPWFWSGLTIPSLGCESVQCLLNNHSMSVCHVDVTFLGCPPPAYCPQLPLDLQCNRGYKWKFNLIQVNSDGRVYHSSCNCLTPVIIASTVSLWRTCMEVSMS